MSNPTWLFLLAWQAGSLCRQPPIQELERGGEHKEANVRKTKGWGKWQVIRRKKCVCFLKNQETNVHTRNGGGQRKQEIKKRKMFFSSVHLILYHFMPSNSPYRFKLQFFVPDIKQCNITFRQSKTHAEQKNQTWNKKNTQARKMWIYNIYKKLER